MRARAAEYAPDWPAALTTGHAADYLEIGVSSFLALARREGVRPVPLGLAVTRWRRADLDELLSRLAARGELPIDIETPETDPAAALERMRLRHRRRGRKP